MRRAGRTHARPTPLLRGILYDDLGNHISHNYRGAAGIGYLIQRRSGEQSETRIVKGITATIRGGRGLTVGNPPLPAVLDLFITLICLGGLSCTHHEVSMAKCLDLEMQKSEPETVEILIPNNKEAKEFFADCKKVWTLSPMCTEIRNRIQAQNVQRYILLERGSRYSIGYDGVCLAELPDHSTVIWATFDSKGQPVGSIRESRLTGPDLDDYLNLLGNPLLPTLGSWPHDYVNSVADGLGYFFEWKNAGTTATVSLAPELMAPNYFHHAKAFTSTGDDRYDELVTKLRATKDHLVTLIYRQ